jgi:hypothetical protein
LLITVFNNFLRYFSYNLLYSYFQVVDVGMAYAIDFKNF